MTGANGKGMFFGVAVAEYDESEWAQLDGALEAMKELGALMDSYGFDTRTVESPTRQQLASEQQTLADLGKVDFRGPLVLVWTGHAEALGGFLGLVLKDTPAQNPGKRDGVHRPASLVSLLFETGSSDSLIILDSCSAGSGDQEMFLENLRELDESSWPAENPGLACIASCRPYEKAVQGAFLTELLTLLRDGPENLEDAGPFKIMWSPNSDAVDLSAILHVIRQQAGGKRMRPRSWGTEACSISFPNPRFDPRGEGGLLDDQLRAMAGEPRRGSLMVETPAMRALSERVRDGSPGLLMLIGGAGTGKTSTLAHVRDELGAGLMSVLPARLGVEGLATEVSGFDSRAAIAIDALDEAAGAEQAAIAELATGWARDRLVIVSSRLASAFGDGGRTAAADLTQRAAEVIDLDQASWRGDAISRYVRQRLDGEDDGA